MDEYYAKKSIYNNDFYTNSIGEATSSFLGKGNKLINNLPQTFVKQDGRFEKKEKIEDESNYTVNNSNLKQENANVISNIQVTNKNEREANCRKLIFYAQKGDKENFLNILEM